MTEESNETQDLQTEAQDPTAQEATQEQPQEQLSPVDVLRDERDKLREQLLRTAADFDNYRKRSRKDAEEAERKGKEETVRELLPVFDNLERALQASQSTTDVNSIAEGIRMVLRLFEEQAGRVGLIRVVAVGEKFDPALHDAIQQVESEEHAPGTIVTEIVPGYKLGDKLVRPAMVVVAKKPAAASEN